MRLIFLLTLSLFYSCSNHPGVVQHVSSTLSTDTVILASMIEDRGKAMKEKDIDSVMFQFSEDTTWINSQGYYFEGKDSVLEFHSMLAGNPEMDYIYESGKPRIRIIDNNNAIAYYSWRMNWFPRGKPGEISKRETGLMTLSARKSAGRWRWIAVTNQHTPWFYDAIEPSYIEHE